MCEIGACCPNCGQPELDADETNCVIIEGIAYREYKCRQCTALINVAALMSELPPGRLWQLQGPRP